MMKRRLLGRARNAAKIAGGGDGSASCRGRARGGGNSGDDGDPMNPKPAWAPPLPPGVSAPPLPPAPKRTVAHLFQPGQSGNPTGRPKSVGEARRLAREQTELAISTLVKIATNEHAPEAARVAVCNSLLDRGYGNPCCRSISADPASSIS